MAKKIALWIVCPMAALLVYHAWSRRWAAYAVAIGVGILLAEVTR